VTSHVLDATAVLAMIRGEAGGDFVWERRRGAVVSAVNYAEVVSRLVRHGKSPEAAQARLEHLQLQPVPFDQAQALTAASLAGSAEALGLSLGDRACLALAISRKLPALTADRRWADLDLGVSVGLIR
jgi:ribonuclease VapC